MSKEDRISSEILNELLRYDPDTGKLYWKERSEKWFSHCKFVSQSTRTWNTKFAGKEALTYSDNHGYRSGHILGISFLAHRVIWCMETGEWPTKDIDHINGITNDNRWENLRSVDASSNNRNTKRRSTNTSGVTGVYWDKGTQKWRVLISKGKSGLTHLGLFSDFDEAVSVRKDAEKKYGYHENNDRVVE